MSNFVTNIPGSGGGSFFAAGDYVNAKAILIDVLRIDRGVQSQWGPRDEAVANLTIFTSADTLTGSEPPVIIDGARITYSILVSDIADFVGKKCIFKLHAFPAKNGKTSYAWRACDPAITDQVIAYAEGKSAPADDDMPDFTAGAPF